MDIWETILNFLKAIKINIEITINVTLPATVYLLWKYDNKK